MDNNYFKKAFSLIKNHEGLKLKVYKCPAGKLTIGYGRNLEDKGISIDEAEILLKNDILDCQKILKTIFHQFDDFSINQKVALIDMVFNLGPGGFLAFRKMIDAIKAGNWQKAKEEALNSKWATQVGKRANEVVKLFD